MLGNNGRELFIRCFNRGVGVFLFGGILAQMALFMLK